MVLKRSEFTKLLTWSLSPLEASGSRRCCWKQLSMCCLSSDTNYFPYPCCSHTDSHEHTEDGRMTSQLWKRDRLRSTWMQHNVLWLPDLLFRLEGAFTWIFEVKKKISLIIPTPPLTHSNIYFSNQSFWRWVALWVTGKSDALSEMILTFLFLCTKTFIVQQFVWLWSDTQGLFYHNINITVFRKWKCGSNCFVCLCFQGFSFVNISCSQLLLFAVLALESVQLFDCQNAHSLDTHN